MHPILFRIPLPGGGSLPLYSYGVMLGLSFIVGWYLTLGLAEKDGLPRETMANCYVITALSAVVASRLLYVLTNLSDFETFWEVFEIRSGGMVAYGGFLGGLFGSWAFLRWKGIPLIPWADVAVPSLASGLLITRIGCYLYGCDFGQPLKETAPAFLKTLGTFPKWTDEITKDTSGSPAWAQHVTDLRIDPSATSSLPVHPTQLYESLVGLGLLTLLLYWRRHQKFRGEIFFIFTFAYGLLRFLLEFYRDDKERGDIPPALAPHILFPLCLSIFAAAYALGLAPRVKNAAVRMATQVAAFVPAVYAFIAFRPQEFQAVVAQKMSTSQFIGLTSAVAAAVAYAIFFKAAEQNPKAAMAMPDFGVREADATPDEEDPVAKIRKAKAAAKKSARAKAEAAEPKEAEAKGDEAEEAEAKREEDAPAPPAAAPKLKKKKKKAQPPVATSLDKDSEDGEKKDGGD